MSKKGSGPPPIEITSKPTIPPLHDDGQEALAFPDQALTDVEPDARDLLSNVLPNGLTNPYATVENGWAVGPQPVDPSSGAPGPSGPLAAYEGANVEALSGTPTGAEANTATGGPAADPYEKSQTLEELWTALGGKSVDMSQELALNAPAGSAAPASVDDASDQQPLHRSIISTLNDPDWGSGTSIAVDISQLADGSKSAGSVQTIPEVTIVGSPSVSGSSDQALMQAIQASVQGTGGQASLGGGAAPPATISEVLAGTDWARPDDAAQLPPQASSQAAPAQPPTPVSPQPGAGQSNPASYDPMVDNALDRFLLRGELPYVGTVPAVAAAMDVVTNDRNLQNVQTGAEALAITAAIAAAAVAAAAAAPAAIAATNNFFATAATGAQTYVPLVAATGAATNSCRAADGPGDRGLAPVPWKLAWRISFPDVRLVPPRPSQRPKSGAASQQGLGIGRRTVEPARRADERKPPLVGRSGRAAGAQRGQCRGEATTGLWLSVSSLVSPTRGAAIRRPGPRRP